MHHERQVVRAVLLSPEDEVLLMHLALPEPTRVLWLTPGGGLERGEDTEAALRRELREETGLADFEMGPEVWRRTHTFALPLQTLTQHERFWIVRTARFEPSVTHMPPGFEKDGFLGYRWWPLDDILQSNELFVPRQLGSLLKSYLVKGAPPEPIDAGI